MKYVHEPYDAIAEFRAACIVQSVSSCCLSATSGTAPDSVSRYIALVGALMLLTMALWSQRCMKQAVAAAVAEKLES